VRPALILVDLQHDYLSAPGLRPVAAEVVARAAELLEGCRSAGLPVLHVWTTVQRDPDRRMAHWRDADDWRCEADTPGQQAPAALAPRTSEPVIHKTAFSAFVEPDLEAALRQRSVDTLILAGVHAHACVRATGLDAYQRGFAVWIVEDAVASDDPLHAEISARYLEARAFRLLTIDQVLAELGGGVSPQEHFAPRDSKQRLWTLQQSGAGDVVAAVAAASAAQRDWAGAASEVRRGLLSALRDGLLEQRETLVEQLAIEVGKPVRDGDAELRFGVALLNALLACGSLSPLEERGAGWTYQRRPRGVVGLVTPFNNPLAIPLGKLAPALLHGNAVVWKPAPAGSGLALALHQLLVDVGCPPGLVSLVRGNRAVVQRLMSDPGVDAVSLTGSTAAGVSAQVVCARRAIPLQAELGGNNPALVWEDADVEAAAAAIVAGAFGFAGQRCTANRRAVVAAPVYDAFLAAVREQTAALRWGDPLDAATRVGPMISIPARRRVQELLARSQQIGCVLHVPHDDVAQRRALEDAGAYLAPAIVEAGDPAAQIVQEESFGPVLVLQRAEGWDRAIELCNGVRQGLVAALFSSSPSIQARFLEQARAGVLKLNRSTAGVEAAAPFGGWGESTLGPPEHGGGDERFYTRGQTVYRDEEKTGPEGEGDA